MLKVLIASLLATASFASTNYANMKNCERIELSKFTALVSCHQVDYLIEYRLVDDEEDDTIKKITAITVKDQKILKNVSKQWF